MLNKPDAPGYWLTVYEESASPCQESLQQIKFCCVAANVAPLWPLQPQQIAATTWWKQNSQAVKPTVGSSFLSFFWSTNVEQWLHLSPALWHNLPIVHNEGLYKQKVQFLFRWKHNCWAHACGFHSELERFLQICITTKLLSLNLTCISFVLRMWYLQAPLTGSLRLFHTGP